MRTFLKKINPMINIPNTHKAINAIKRLAIVLVKIITTIPIDNNCTDDIY